MTALCGFLLGALCGALFIGLIYFIYLLVNKYKYRTLMIENLRSRTSDLNRRVRDIEYTLREEILKECGVLNDEEK